MARAMETRLVLVDVSQAMGQDLEVAKKALVSMAQQKMIQVRAPRPHVKRVEMRAGLGCGCGAAGACERTDRWPPRAVVDHHRPRPLHPSCARLPRACRALSRSHRVFSRALLCVPAWHRRVEGTHFHAANSVVSCAPPRRCASLGIAAPTKSIA
jgi:hypothetical protein